MIESPAEPPGFAATLRSLADGVLAGVQDRVALLAVELQEEKYRLIRNLLWIVAAFFAGVMALTFASLAIVYLFWEQARLAVLGGLALVYGLALVAILFGLKRERARRAPPFAATLEEISEDRSCIRPRD
jgi:uncharacterized membrane protein YqjE